MSACEVPGEPAGLSPLAALRLEFPGWHPWRSSTGRYWASRVLDREKPSELPFEDSVTWAMTVDGDDETQLRDAIAAQEASAPP